MEAVNPNKANCADTTGCCSENTQPVIPHTSSTLLGLAINRPKGDQMPVRTIILSNLLSNLYQCRINSCKAQNTSAAYVNMKSLGNTS